MPSPTFRSALDALTKTRLLEIAGRFEIEIAAARPKPQVVDALVRSRRTSLDQLLGAMKLDDLKKICRTHGLDESAREKQVLIDRILGVEGTVARDAGPGYQVFPEPRPVELPPKRRRRSKPAAGEDAAEAPSTGWASSTKLRLQRFALGAAGGYLRLSNAYQGKTPDGRPRWLV